MSRSWNTWIQHHKKHQPHSFWADPPSSWQPSGVNTNTNLTNTVIKNMERLLSPRLSCETPPGSGMFCLPFSYPCQVFSCCIWAAVGLLCPFPTLSKERAQSQAKLRVSSSQEATSCTPTASASHTAPTRLLSRGKGSHEQTQQEKGEPTPHSFLCCASLACPWGVRAHITSPSGKSSRWAP